MNIITVTDSPMLYSRLNTLLSDMPDVKLVSVVENLDEAEKIIYENNIQFLLIAFHNTKMNAFQKLNELKIKYSSMVVIVLTSNTSEQHLSFWHNAGADYVFDQAFQFNKIIDLLSEHLYLNLLHSLRLQKTSNNTTSN